MAIQVIKELCKAKNQQVRENVVAETAATTQFDHGGNPAPPPQAQVQQPVVVQTVQQPPVPSGSIFYVDYKIKQSSSNIRSASEWSTSADSNSPAACSTNCLRCTSTAYCPGTKKRTTYAQLRRGPNSWYENNKNSSLKIKFSYDDEHCFLWNLRRISRLWSRSMQNILQ